MGAKTKDYKVDWLYPTTQYNYDGNLPKKYRYCFGAKKLRNHIKYKATKIWIWCLKIFHDKTKAYQLFKKV